MESGGDRSKYYGGWWLSDELNASYFSVSNAVSGAHYGVFTLRGGSIFNSLPHH